MTGPRVSATSAPLTEADERKRGLAWDLLRASNEPVLGFAKLMVPTSLSSVGAIIALAKDGGQLTAGTPRTLIVLACGLNLCSMLLFAWVVYARPLHVSTEDYEDVVEELLRAASVRQMVATVGLALLTAGVIFAVLAFVVS